jgi:hypothetical protein
MSINGNLFVGNDLSYAGNLYVKPNSIDPMAIRYGISNQFGTFQYNYTTPNTALYDADGFGILRYIDSSSQVLYSKTDLSLNGNLYVDGTTTSTAFNALSDYRLKDNITNLDGTYIIDNLRPVKYTFKSNNSQQLGFIAHEVQQYYPMLVEGEKDGPNHQSINMNGIIPLLVNDLKRSKERIDELENRMKNLEEQLSRMI